MESTLDSDPFSLIPYCPSGDRCGRRDVSGALDEQELVFKAYIGMNPYPMVF